QELTAQALRDGHFPVTIIRESPLTELPRDLEALRATLFAAIRRACETFGIEEPPEWQMLCLSDPEAYKANLAPRIRTEYLDAKKLTVGALQRAWRADLAPVLARARQATPPIISAASRAILVFDELQVYNEELLSNLFNNNVLGPYGLGTKTESIPVVLAFSLNNATSEILRPIAKKPLKNPWLKKTPIEAFNGPEEMLTYERLLLHPSNPEIRKGFSDVAWAVKDELTQTEREEIEEEFHYVLEGKPANFS